WHTWRARRAEEGEVGQEGQPGQENAQNGPETQGSPPGESCQGEGCPRGQQDPDDPRSAEALGRSHPEGNYESDRLAGTFRARIHQRYAAQEDGPESRIHQGRGWRPHVLV